MIRNLSFLFKFVLTSLKSFELFTGNNHLLKIRLLETGFLSRFQLNP
jgi:hypothetical protein